MSTGDVRVGEQGLYGIAEGVGAADARNSQGGHPRQSREFRCCFYWTAFSWGVVRRGAGKAEVCRFYHKGLGKTFRDITPSIPLAFSFPGESWKDGWWFA